MGFFDNLKLKKAAKSLNLTVEEYTVYLTIEADGVTVDQYKTYLSQYKGILTPKQYANYLTIDTTAVSIQDYQQYLFNYANALKLCDYPMFLKLGAFGLSPNDRINYIHSFLGKLSPEEYVEFLKIKDYGYDAALFKEYTSSNTHYSVTDFPIASRLSKQGVAESDIETYISKHKDALTPEQYVEYLKLDASVVSIQNYKKYLYNYTDTMTLSEYVDFLKLDNSVVNMRDYKRYLEKFSKELSLEEFEYFCRAKKTEFEFWNNGKKEKHPTDEMALKYAKNYQRLSIENFIEYYDIEHGYRNAGFDYLGELDIESYATFLETENKLTPYNTNDEYDKRDTEVAKFLIMFSKTYIRKNSVIENGVLKKYTGADIDFFCIPDEVTTIPKNAIRVNTETHFHFLCHNSFKSLSLGKNINVFGINTYFDDYTGMEEFFFEQCFPASMESFNLEGIWLDTGTIKAPIAMKNCEALQDKDVKWFDPAKPVKKKTATTKKETPIKTEPAEVSKEETVAAVSVQEEPETKIETESSKSNIITTGNQKTDKFYGLDGQLEEVTVDSAFKIQVPKSFAYSTDPAITHDMFKNCLVALYDEGNTVLQKTSSGIIRFDVEKKCDINSDGDNFAVQENADFALKLLGSVTRAFPPHNKVTGERNIYVEYCLHAKIDGFNSYAFTALVGNGCYCGHIEFTYDMFPTLLKLSAKEEEKLIKTWLKTIRPVCDGTTSTVSVQEEPEIKVEEAPVKAEPIEVAPVETKPAKTASKTSTKKAGGKDYQKIIDKLDVSFPMITDVRLRRKDVDRVNNRIETMYVGEEVFVKPEKPSHADDWDVVIEVLDSNGLILGYSDCMGENQLYKIEDILTAKVSSVTPLSQRRKGSKYALLEIEIDYDLDRDVEKSSVPKLENKFTVKYSADGKSGTKKFPDLIDASKYVESLMLSTENGYAQVLDEDGNDLPDQGAVWC